MLEFGVDEITLVLQLSPVIRNKITVLDWPILAEEMICRFVEKSEFRTIFGDSIPESRPPSGYTTAYTYGEHSFYLAVAYHEFHMRMGVVIKFSALSLDYYCEASGLKVYEFLQKIQDSFYTSRLSRIDLTADYINEGIDVTTIYQNFIDNKVGIFREETSKKTGEISYRRSIMQYRGYIKGQEVPTIYIGSAQSNSMLRIYDKKREQLERKGSKFDEAKKCKDWTRFEGVFRNEFAHQLSEVLLNIGTEDEYANLISCTMIQKFRLMYIDNGVVDCDTEISQMLLDTINNKNFSLKSSSTRNYDLAKNLSFLFYGSGVISTLYKVKSIWGDNAVFDLLTFIDDYLNEFEPNDDCRYWLRKNKDDYIKNHPDFDVFFSDNLSMKL